MKTINSLEELENQNETKYGVLNNGSVQKFFKESQDPLYLKMFSHMREHQTFVDATSEGVKKARSENYAYITEQPYLEYYNQQKPCNTRLLNGLLQAKGYGIGLQQNSPYTNRISVAILAVNIQSSIFLSLNLSAVSFHEVSVWESVKINQYKVHEPFIILAKPIINPWVKLLLLSVIVALTSRPVDETSSTLP